MAHIGALQLIILFIILFTRCLTVQADSSDADNAYEMGNYAFSFNEYMKRAEHGDIRSQVNVGWMYYYGEGVNQDKAQAMVWYQKAAKQGDLTSMFNLAYAYEHGDGVSQDLKESGKWYKKATSQSNVFERLNFERLTKQYLIPDSNQSQLARMLTKKGILFGKKTTEAKVPTSADPKANTAHLPSPKQNEAIHSSPTEQLATSAASIGKKDAGSMLPTSKSSEIEKFQNPRLEKIRRAAEAGDTSAQVALGWIYSSGEEKHANKDKAVRWYRIAAEKGNINAQLALGWIYYDVQEYKRDLNESALWYRKAAAQGNIKARQMLTNIKKICKEADADLKLTAGCPATKW